MRKSSELESAASLPQDLAEKPLTQDEKDVFEYAWQLAVQQSRSPGGHEENAEVSPPSSDVVTADFLEDVVRLKNSVSIEEIVSRLRAEANRLHIRKTDQENMDQVHSLVKRLNHMATMLLRKADYIAITNADGHLSYANGAFLSLLLPETEITEAPHQRPESKRAQKERLERQRIWEARLNSCSPGITRFPDPVSGTAEEEWLLQRTIIEDETTQKEAAYLNVLRHADSQRLPTGTLAKLEPFLSELTFYASMYAYGSEKPANEVLEKLNTLIDKMYKATGFRKPSSRNKSP